MPTSPRGADTPTGRRERLLCAGQAGSAAAVAFVAAGAPSLIGPAQLGGSDATRLVALWLSSAAQLAAEPERLDQALSDYGQYLW